MYSTAKFLVGGRFCFTNDRIFKKEMEGSPNHVGEKGLDNLQFLHFQSSQQANELFHQVANNPIFPISNGFVFSSKR